MNFLTFLSPFLPFLVGFAQKSETFSPGQGEGGLLVTNRQGGGLGLWPSGRGKPPPLPCPCTVWHQSFFPHFRPNTYYSQVRFDCKNEDFPYAIPDQSVDILEILSTNSGSRRHGSLLGRSKRPFSSSAKKIESCLKRVSLYTLQIERSLRS